MGDTFYFFDKEGMDTDLAKIPDVLEAALGANLVPRKNVNFLNTIRRVPTYAVWDDHDFRRNNKDSRGFPRKDLSRKAFLSYWGNPEPVSNSYGLTSRLTYGNVDIYLMDGRYVRDKNKKTLFTPGQCKWVVNDIKNRGAGRMRILVSGSAWNHSLMSKTYQPEIEKLYKRLTDLIGSGIIKGLIFLSGDIHKHAIYEILLPNDKVAPEIICSPLTRNFPRNSIWKGMEKEWHKLKNEVKKVSSLVKGTLRSLHLLRAVKNRNLEIRWRRRTNGFASIHIDTRIYARHPSWTMTVRFRKRKDGSVFKTLRYVLENNQFKWRWELP